MELRHLRYFIAVAELLHFGRAARRLHVTQPSLSHQIRQLETELQTRLLERTRRRVELTEAGRVFLDEAREIIARADHAALIARRAAHDETPRLRIGIGYCMDQSFVSAVVAALDGRREGVRVELQTMAVPHQITALRDERLDVGLIRSTPVGPPVVTETLFSEPLVAALPTTHRLAHRRRISLAALARETFVLVPRDAVPVYHNVVLEACREAGFVPDAPHEADQLQIILGLVAAGTGISLVPASAQTAKIGGVAFRSLDPPATGLDTSIAWRSDGPPVVAEFVARARGVAAAAERRTKSLETAKGVRALSPRFHS